jgi:transposase
VPALPSWLAQPLWDQFAALLPARETYVSTHPLGCHRRRIPDRIVFDKLLQVLRFGCSYQGIADSTCSATTLRDRRDEWIRLGLFTQLKQIALDAYDRIVGLLLDDIAVDGCITKAPGGGEVAGPSPVDRRKQGMKRSLLVEGYGIPLGRVLAGANRHDSPLLPPTLDLLDDLGPLPEQITVHLDSGYDSGKTRDALAERGLHGEIARKARRHRSRPPNAGMWNAPTPGTTASTGCSAATNAAKSSSRRSSTLPMRSSPCVA